MRLSALIAPWGIKGAMGDPVFAVARKLAVLLHHMWIDGSEFRQE